MTFVRLAKGTGGGAKPNRSVPWYCGPMTAGDPSQSIGHSGTRIRNVGKAWRRIGQRVESFLFAIMKPHWRTDGRSETGCVPCGVESASYPKNSGRERAGRYPAAMLERGPKDSAIDLASPVSVPGAQVLPSRSIEPSPNATARSTQPPLHEQAIQHSMSVPMPTPQ